MVSLAWVRRRALIGPRGGKHQEGKEKEPEGQGEGGGGNERGGVTMRAMKGKGGVVRCFLSGIRMCM